MKEFQIADFKAYKDITVISYNNDVISFYGFKITIMKGLIVNERKFLYL